MPLHRTGAQEMSYRNWRAQVALGRFQEDLVVELLARHPVSQCFEYPAAPVTPSAARPHLPLPDISTDFVDE